MLKTVPISKITQFWRKAATQLLASSWFTGIILGFVAANSASATLVAVVRQCVGASVSVIEILSVTLLPFLMSAFAVSFSEPWLLLFISTFKAFSFSFCAWGVCLAFGQSGWLVLFLFLFSDILLIPVLYFYWMRHIKGEKTPSVWEFPLFLGVAIGIGCIDFWFIAPFLASLMK